MQRKAQNPQVPRFAYQNLSHPREIRVLCITANPDIVLTLEHKDLDVSPLYTAVSYTWGPELPQYDLIINGGVLRVSATVASMIVSLTDKRYPRSVWIDAVCIDQSSTADQNHQVRLMGDIYSRANYVIAYLEGICSLRQLGRMFKPASKQGMLAFIFDTLSLGNEQSVETAARQYDSSLLRHKYFTRRWVIQEFCLARSVEFHYGGATHTLDDIGLLIWSVGGAFYARSATSLCKLREAMKNSVPTLEQLLYDHKMTTCARYQDKIYALLSLTHQARLNLDVDYSLPPIDLLLSVVCTCYLHEGLSPSHVMSFVCLLIKQLEVLRDDLYRKIVRNESRPLPAGTIFTASARLRGVVLEHLDSGRQPASRLRKYVPPMTTYSVVTLRRVCPEQVPSSTNTGLNTLDLRPAQQTRVMFDGEVLHETGPSVSPNDLWPFAAWQDIGAKPTTRLIGCTGLCTIATKTTDEVWSFPHTPVALVLRLTDGGYTIVGRALLLKESDRTRNLHTQNMNLETILDWTDDFSDTETAESPVMDFELKPFQLLQLLCWVKLDE